jgi:hypothetical protein
MDEVQHQGEGGKVLLNPLLERLSAVGQGHPVLDVGAFTAGDLSLRTAALRRLLPIVRSDKLPGDLYDRTLEVHFVEKLRDECRFPDVQTLAEQIRRDEEQARRILGALGPW